MSLEQLQLKNFQAHKALTIDLAPGVTTIVGPTDKGKSAIIRALRWVATNQPSGEDFIRYGTKQSSATLVADSFSIVRTKGKNASLNEYEVDGEILKAFGQGVPKPVEALMKVEPSITFQGQHDSPFWFSLTSGEVSRRLNSVIDLSVIDHSLSAAASHLKKSKERAEVFEEIFLKADKSLEEAKAACPAKRIERFEKLENAFNSLEKKKVKLGKLEKVTTRAFELSQSTAAKQAKAAKQVTALASPVATLSKRIWELKQLLAAIDKLQQVKKPEPISHIDALEIQIRDRFRKAKELGKLITSIKAWKEIKPPQSIEGILFVLEDVKNLKRNLEALTILMERVWKRSDRKDAAEEQVKVLKQELEEFKKEHTCPTCGQIYHSCETP